MIRIAVVTISDGVRAGTREDTSGRAINAWALANSHDIVRHVTLGDNTDEVSDALRKIADAGDVDVIVTTGGTGLTERDITPEATAAVLDRLAPGISEGIRAEGARHAQYTWLSRGVSGTRGRTLIINLPGSESGVRDGLRFLDRILAHAVQLIRGIDTQKHTE